MKYTAPASFSDEKGMTKVGLELTGGLVVCKTCNTKWSSSHRKTDAPLEWWECPNGCNVVPDNVKVDERDINPTQTDLKEFGVRVLDRNKINLQCFECNETWTPELTKGHKLPKDWWICPKGCNKDSRV